MEERIKNLEKRIEEQNSRSDHRFEEMMKMLQSIQAEMNKTRDSMVSSPDIRQLDRSKSTRTLGMNTKLQLPKFDGTNPRNWVKECCRFFSLYEISDEQKVDIASLNVVDKAEIWIMNYLAIRKNIIVDWNDFVVDLYARFKDDNRCDVVEQFNRQQQTNSIEEYMDECENLSPVMLPHAYVLESGVGELNSAIKPKTISDAVEFARYQEETLEVNVQESFTKSFVQTSYTSKSNQDVPLLSSISTRPSLLHTPQIKSTQNTYKHILAEVRKCQSQLFTAEFLGKESKGVDAIEDDYTEMVKMQGGTEMQGGNDTSKSVSSCLRILNSHGVVNMLLLKEEFHLVNFIMDYHQTHHLILVGRIQVDFDKKMKMQVKLLARSRPPPMPPPLCLTLCSLVAGQNSLQGWLDRFVVALFNIIRQEFMIFQYLIVFNFLISMMINRLEGKSIFQGGKYDTGVSREFCYFQSEGKVVKSLLAQFLHLLQFVRENQMSG